MIIRLEPSAAELLSTKICLCNDCPHGPDERVIDSGISAQSFCDIGGNDVDGHFMPDLVMPRWVNKDLTLASCKTLMRFKTWQLKKSAA